MRIEFEAIVPAKNNNDLINQYAIYSLLGSAIAEVSDRNEQERLFVELKPDTKYRVIVEEVRDGS